MPNATQILRNGSRLIRLRDALMAGHRTGHRHPGTALRAEIAASWQRSVAHGVRPDRFSVPSAAPAGSADMLRLAAGPVADAVADDLAGTGVSLLVSDDGGCILDRRVPDASLRARLDRIYLAPGFGYGEQAVGTTAISVALSQRRPALVAAGEHYADTLTAMVCAAAPVIDPESGNVLGTVGLACRAEAASPLMIAFAKRAARDVEQRIAARLAARPRMRDAWDALTAAERDVSVIIAECVTNREAAARLCLSPHTIDYHLRQIFRKLGVTSRVELVRLVVTLNDRG